MTHSFVIVVHSFINEKYSVLVLLINICEHSNSDEERRRNKYLRYIYLYFNIHKALVVSMPLKLI